MSEINYVDGWPQPYRLLDAEPYWQALEQEKLKYQKCTDCDQAVWPAHSFCPHCSSRSLVWESSTGRGTIYSFSTVMRGPTAKWNEMGPYTVGFVKMEEGYFLFTEFEGAPETIEIGKSVGVRFIRRGKQVLPIFALAQ